MAVKSMIAFLVYVSKYSEYEIFYARKNNQ